MNTVSALSLPLTHGRACVSDEELALIQRTVIAAGHGDHLEIGSMWGGTAIAAAKAKAAARLKGKVVCVDSFIGSDGEWGTANPDVFWQNIDETGVRDRVELHVCSSDPWPFPADQRFVSALIDGDHSAPWPERDWGNVSKVCPLILVHDVYRDPACTHLHGLIVEDPGWEVQEHAEPWMFLYKRI